MTLEAAIAKAVAMLVTVGLACSNPTVLVKPAGEMPKHGDEPALGAFMDPAKLGHNELWINAEAPAHKLQKIVLHEFLHCGHYEFRAAYGLKALGWRDQHEEMVTRAQTDYLLGTEEGE